MKAMKHFKLNSRKLLRMQFTGFYIEAIADETRRIARFLHNSKNLSPNNKKDIVSLIKKLHDYYSDTMKASYNDDVESALKYSVRKAELFKMIKLFVDTEMNGAVSHLQRMTGLIHNLGRIIYTSGV